jgi:hypothetical protein
MPQDLRHGQVEIIIFPFSKIEAAHAVRPKSTSTKSASITLKKSARFPNLALNMQGYTFDRQEANERYSNSRFNRKSEFITAKSKQTIVCPNLRFAKSNKFSC